MKRLIVERLNCAGEPSRKRDVLAESHMPCSFVRILVVDDFDPWQVCSILGARPELRAIAEAADGLEAVQKAEELKPGLILLDIGLPNLDRLEAANRIRQAAPNAAIIFLTENRGKDVVRAALSTGARGYVLKTDAGRQFLTAMATVLRGNDFVSSRNQSGQLWRNRGHLDVPATPLKTANLPWQVKTQPDRFPLAAVIRFQELKIP
jgi:DNA-binding NarL/FixJ family response regulator